ncbi:MAG TPA: PD-(D/E)XK nuclease family protein [Ktedonobacteraceae bacterium]
MNKNMQNTAFNWHIDRGDVRPPRGRPEAPFGPTAIEMIRTCGLRACFEVSQGYERRTAYAARVGIAFHKALQSLTERPFRSDNRSELIGEAHRRFRHELALQEEQKNRRPRERMLPHDEERVDRALEAIASEALRLAKQPAAEQVEHQSRGTTATNKAHPAETESARVDKVLVEVPVQSQDGLLTGRVDYAERLPTGIRLLDYKSALRDGLPARYERQLQLYALLWYETFGEWPVEAWVTYPLTGAMHRIAIDPETCFHVGNDARALIRRLQETPSAEELATPGEACTMCEFRPWCQPFWAWQAKQPSLSKALQTAVLGFEGQIVAIELKDYYWVVKVGWRDAEVRIVAPQERFPQLKNASVGMSIRVLDMRLQGQRYRPQAAVAEHSEIFLV